ncbi:MAG TPA: hypothetical protein VGF88_09985 [Acidobacteriaceae bacterium]|jgi:hypothetical protein
MDPELSSQTVTLVFPHSWKAEILLKRPLIKPLRCYTYPREAEEVERGALEVLVQPAGKAVKFLATFALGFKDPAVPSGLWSCPAADELCAVAGGYAYIVNALGPADFTHIALRPVLEIISLPEQRLLIFAGHQTLLAWGEAGEAWRTPPLTSEGLRLTEVHGDDLHGFGWDLSSDRELPFTVDLRNGWCSGAYVDAAR